MGIQTAVTLKNIRHVSDSESHTEKTWVGVGKKNVISQIQTVMKQNQM